MDEVAWVLVHVEALHEATTKEATEPQGLHQVSPVHMWEGCVCVWMSHSIDLIVPFALVHKGYQVIIMILTLSLPDVNLLSFLVLSLLTDYH